MRHHSRSSDKLKADNGLKTPSKIVSLKSILPCVHEGNIDRIQLLAEYPKFGLAGKLANAVDEKRTLHVFDIVSRRLLAAKGEQFRKRSKWAQYSR